MAKFIAKKRCKYCAAVLNENGECTCATFVAEKEATQRIDEMKESEEKGDAVSE